MSYRQLYARAQDQPGKVSTRWMRDQIIDITPVTTVKEQWTGLIDETQLRGFYIEGPLGPPIPLAENEVLITLARSLNRDWRRIVYTKELMHSFDTDEEKADTAEKFELQMEDLGDPSSEMSPQARAEIKAFWRALGVLCNADLRDQFRLAFEREEMSAAIIAARLRIPERYIRHLVRTDFQNIIDPLM